MRKILYAVGLLAAVLAVARWLLNEIGLLQTAYDIATGRLPGINWMIDILFWPLTGPIVSVACLVAFVFLRKSNAQDTRPSSTATALAAWASNVRDRVSSILRTSLEDKVPWSSDAIPYVEIRKLANAKGWELNDDSTPCVNRAYCLEDAMQQAAIYGHLRVWGRRCETTIGSNPLLRIPKKHFKDFTFHYGYLTGNNVENTSTYTWKPGADKNRSSFGRDNYCDLYVSRSDINSLLCRISPSDCASGSK